MKPPYGNHYSRQVQQLLDVLGKKQQQVCAALSAVLLLTVGGGCLWASGGLPCAEHLIL
jgi:hypothetical protein